MVKGSGLTTNRYPDENKMQLEVEERIKKIPFEVRTESDYGVI